MGGLRRVSNNHSGGNPNGARDRRRLYLAGPLFSVGEKAFNVRVRKLLEPYFSTYLPQEDGILLAEVVAGKESPSAVDPVSQAIFAGDLSAIRNADVLLAILDGRSIDEGTAFEIGFAYAIGKPCFGLQTDPRRLLPQGNNPMISKSLKQVFTTLETLQNWAATYGSSEAI